MGKKIRTLLSTVQAWGRALPKGLRDAGSYMEPLLLLVGVSLLLAYVGGRIDEVVRSKAALHEFAQLKPSAARPRLDAAPRVVEEDSVQEQKQRLANQGLLAVLQIPRIGIEVPVFEGTDELTLNHGAGRIAGTARPGEDGNIGIAAHRDSFFRPLKNIRIGDAIELETPDKTDRYVVDRIDIVAPEDTAVLQAQSVPTLTLVTCYPFHFIGSAPKRYIVTASLAKASLAKETTSETATADSRLGTTNHEFHKEEQ